MVDFSKTFYRNDLVTLVTKLSNIDIPPILINRCANFLPDFNCGQIQCHWKQINAGVPHRTIPGRLFLLVMINVLLTLTSTKM